MSLLLPPAPRHHADQPGHRGLLVSLLSVVLLATTLTAGSSAAAPGLVLARSRHHQAPLVEHYTPRPGPVFIDPRDDTHGAILAEIRKSIRSVEHQQQIRIFTWNLASPGFVNDLLDANARGVSVRVIISEGNINNDFQRLQRGLRERSTTHPQTEGQQSWARSCARSCRGTRGIAHSKFYVFSRVGRAQQVVISSSANATEVAAKDQWDDSYTLVGNEAVYDKFIDVFDQSAGDQPAHPGYQTVDTKWASAYFYPWKGPQARGDRVLKVLKAISCRGTSNGTGVGGRTEIRIAQDAILDQRGIAIAKILRTLWEQGCNIRMVFSLLGNEARDVLDHTRRGPVPRHQIVSDFNGDGVYDRYLHSKVLMVSGHYGQQRDAHVTWQGSENWSGLAKLSDEQGLVLYGLHASLRYTRWIDGLYANPPMDARTAARNSVSARRSGVDPYAIIRANM